MAQNIIVILIVVIAAAWGIRRIIRQMRGKGGCGCGCTDGSGRKKNHSCGSCKNCG